MKRVWAEICYTLAVIVCETIIGHDYVMSAQPFCQRCARSAERYFERRGD